ncbi:HAMP domain-containing histidine kinase [Acidaminobacter sp. JC074]|uniref:sensor histidine kinase n=1 Tax=Acidaminobacter sp. JC074 TaxID=2530199 RepID=UPI001F0E3316|nr:HAMP domain-containing sensor histidine kinase [Acidaminobacter sp. JC074]MCH4890759.1 HAMP domain-containing histidine kinase [Acidaminobacter sp. JC074]
MKRKRQINKRILASFILVLIITFFISILVYSAISKQYIIKESRAELRRVAVTTESIMERFLTRNASSNLKAIRLIQEVEQFNKVLETEVIILGDNNKLVYTSVEDIKTENVKNLLETARLNDEEYVFINHDLNLKDTSYKSMILYKKYDDIKRVRGLGIMSLIISFAVGAVLALIVGIYQSQKIYKPIKSLKDTMQLYMKDKSEVEVNYSNDEIEELSLIFKKLTDKINNLDMRQKQFFQNSSHELKTPLMSIQGYVEAIKDGIVTGEEKDKSLDIIISETQRLKNIVDDVIYLSKVDSLEENFIMSNHSLLDIINDAKEVVTPFLTASDLDFEVNCDPSLDIYCDYDKIKRVFINLISNGSRYAKSKIVVNAAIHDARLVIDVIDDGQGFDYGQEASVFDRFYKGKKGGSGIGLALTKEIVEKHGGKIKAINHMNYGAVFNMEFPVDKKKQ